MNQLALVLITALGVVLLGIPLTAVAVVHRDELVPRLTALGRALAFDPRHAALNGFGR